MFDPDLVISVGGDCRNTGDIIVMALIKKPENYNGADPEAFGEWFDRFKLIATVNAWDNAKQLAIIPTLLTQHAYRIFNELDAVVDFKYFLRHTY